MDFLAGHDLLESTDPVQLAIRLLLPEGSLLVDLPETRRFLDEYDPQALSYRWRSVDPEIDRLQLRLARLAEEGGEDRRGTLAAMWKVVATDSEIPAQSDRIVPRLTEAWFCCAEPTTRQLSEVAPTA